MKVRESNEEAQVTRKDGGLPKYAFLYPWWVDVDGKRFLTRFILFRSPWFGVSVTRIHTADDIRKYPHDHSHSFITWLLGWYNEQVYYDPNNLNNSRLLRHRRFSAHLLRYTQAHSITEVSPGLVTVLFSWRTRQKSTYWTPNGKQLTGVNPDEA
jgi:hypothetical protein